MGKLFTVAAFDTTESMKVPDDNMVVGMLSLSKMKENVPEL